MTEPPLILDAPQRVVVEHTIAEHCRIRGWHLHAVSCRSNHVHVVLSASGRNPEAVMDQFKAWCTRRLKEQATARVHRTRERANWWTQRGSRRWINDNQSLESAITYVLEAQDKKRSDE
jgi:REP element-mobilizing transposase RayT